MARALVSSLAVLLVVTLALIAGDAAAQVYRWVDKDGKVHYSDKAPKDVQAKDMGIDSKPADPAAAERTLEELRQQNAGLDQLEADRAKAAADKKRDEEQRARRCDQARAQLAQLERVSRYITVGADGKETYDSDAQLAERRATARQRVTELCE